MSRITLGPDKSYHWDCPVDKDFHQKSGRQGLWAVVFICAFVFILFLIINHGPGTGNDLWIPLLVIAVILVISLPLLLLWNSADDPHEQYVLTEDGVKSGYGKSTIYTDFKNTREVAVTSRYIELSGKYRKNRIYVPTEDMAFVRDFILKRLPDDVMIHKKGDHYE